MNNDSDENYNDNLLNDLNDLDGAIDEMQENIVSNNEAKSKSNGTNYSVAIDSATISLEAAQIAQASAEYSQTAIDTAIKLSHEQQESIQELADSNGAWRNSISQANISINNSKSTMGVMLTVSIIISLIAAGAIGYLYYTLDKSNKMMKGDVLDIISTELSLSGKKQQVKLDKLASFFEHNSANSQVNASTNKVSSSSVLANTSKAIKDNQISKKIILEQNKQQKIQLQKIESLLAKIDANLASNKTTAIQPAIKKELNSVKDTVITVDDSKIKKQIEVFNKLQQQQMQKIEELLTKINSNQKNLHSKQTSPQAIAPIKVTAMGLTESQLKKLNEISFAIQKQSKVLTTIQRKVSVKYKKPKRVYKKSAKKVVQKRKLKKPQPNKIEKLLGELKIQIKQLQKQQTVTQNQVKSLQTTTKGLNSKPRLYRYQSRD